MLRLCMHLTPHSANTVIYENTDPSNSSPVLTYTNYGSNSTKLAKHLEKEVAHLALLPGDLSYANGVRRDFEPACIDGGQICSNSKLFLVIMYPSILRIFIFPVLSVSVKSSLTYIFLSLSQFLTEWDFFGAQFESSFTRWPIAVTMGNHERDFNNQPNPTATFSGTRAVA